MDFRTKCARGGGGAGPIGRPLTTPVVMSSTFVHDSQSEVEDYYETGRGYLYGRYANPTVRAAERHLAELEGGEDAALFASGMAAISTVCLTLARAGDRIAAQRELYGGTQHLLTRLLPELGIETVWLDRDELASLTPQRLEGCRFLYLETPINPTLRLVDLARASRVAREAGIDAVVDGTFATPVLQQPLALGCRLVIHSCTKYLGGHSDLLGGAVIGDRELITRIALRRRDLGGTLDPLTGFLLQRGLRTLAVRMEAHERGAEVVARMLEGRDRVRKVYWPGLPAFPDHELARSQMRGFGGMVSFEVEGGHEQARRVHDRLELFARAGSLGGVESLVCMPARMSHRHLSDEECSRIGVTPGMLRLSIGLESPRDLVEDLTRALEE